MGRGDGASRVDAGADAAMDSDLRDAGPGDVGARDSGQDAAAPDAAVRDTGQDAVVCATTAPRVTGSFVASPWFGRVDGAGSAITFVTSGGPMGSLALTGGVTVTGSAVATELCTATCSPLSFRGVTASDHTLTFRDWRDVTSTLTLVGATATGGLELMGSDGYLVSVVGSAGTITFSNGATPPLTGTISLVPETSCR